ASALVTAPPRRIARATTKLNTRRIIGHLHEQGEKESCSGEYDHETLLLLPGSAARIFFLQHSGQTVTARGANEEKQFLARGAGCNGAGDLVRGSPPAGVGWFGGWFGPGPQEHPEDPAQADARSHRAGPDAEHDEIAARQ